VIEEDKKLLIEIIKKHLPQTKIYLFGSRARKDHVSESDIDIALNNGKKIDSDILGIIKEKAEESTIPFTVDIIDLHATSKDLKTQILKDGILWP